MNYGYALITYKNNCCVTFLFVCLHYKTREKNLTYKYLLVIILKNNKRNYKKKVLNTSKTK